MSIDLNAIRGFIEEARTHSHTPGTAVGIVQNDGVVLCEGFGKLDADRDDPVTKSTLFAIGSATKTFTAFAIGQLADEGKIDLDRPVRTYLPSFMLYDSVATERVTTTDLLSHRMGLPRHDLVWYNAARTRAELLGSLKYLRPSKDLREEFQYQNLMFMVAGILVEHLTGQTWEEFVRARILQPIGMSRSNFSVETSKASDDFAVPHTLRENTVERIPFRNIDAVGPAGSINSSAEDMLGWLRLNLNGGRNGEQQILSEATLNQLHTPQMVLRQPIPGPEMLSISYGLGWFIVPYRGTQVLYHPGGIDGFSAIIAIVPSQQTGIVVLSNRSRNWLPAAVTYRVIDEVLGLDPVDWTSRFQKQLDDAVTASRQTESQLESDRKVGHPPAHQLEEYAGEYAHPGYGLFRLEVNGNGLKGWLNDIEYQVEPYHYEVFTFSFHAEERQRLLATFSSDLQGNVSRFSIQLEPAVESIEFVRVPDQRLSDPELLRRFAGTYIVMEMPLTVECRGTQLVAILPGQPTYELAPYRGSTFTVSGMTGFSVTFKENEAGDVVELELVQPGAVLTGKRRAETS